MFTLAAGVPTRVFPLAGVPSNRTRAFTPRSVAPRGVPATASGAHPASPAAVAHHDLPAKVYIEHTDAYQVVYHANYFKFLRRGREAALFGHRARDDDHHHHSADAPLAPDLLPPSCATVLVVAVDDVVFARSATLGDDLIVHTRFLGAGERTLTLRQDRFSTPPTRRSCSPPPWLSRPPTPPAPRSASASAPGTPPGTRGRPRGRPRVARAIERRVCLFRFACRFGFSYSL